MDATDKESAELSLLDRFSRAWFPPAAIVGAFAGFVAAAFRTRPEPKAAPRRAKAASPSQPLHQIASAAPPARVFDREYFRTAFPAGALSSHPFRRSLSGLAVGPGDKIYALGDDEVRIFDTSGALTANWRVIENAACFALGPGGIVCVAAANRIEIYEAGGHPRGRIEAGEPGRPASITAIKFYQEDLLIGDAAARIIRRIEISGRQLGIIGDKSKAGKFILPNKSLDFDVDSKGVIRATDTGRHQVTAWALDGTPLGSFGKFGMINPEDFVGCCNPVNLALTPAGEIVTAEKMVARVKVYTPGGKLLAVIGSENFDPNCTHIHLAVDSKGRILTADPVRREIRIFSQVAKAGANEAGREEYKRS